MRISIDGGALCENKNRYGNFVFSRNLITALYLYDKKNDYIVYGFCKKPAWFKERNRFHYQELKPTLFWSSVRLSLEQLTNPTDVFLALNQAIPIYVSGKVITFCHGLAYYFYPQYYSEKDNIRLNRQLKEMIKRSDKIITSSIKVKKELISINQLIDKKIQAIPFGIPFDMTSKFRIKIKKLKEELKEKKIVNKYFLFVGMNHRIKNIEFIKQVFNEFRKNKNYRDYKLYLITKKFSRNKLKRLYQNATGLLTASHYESFNLPVLEALSQGCPIVGSKSAIIPELAKYVYVATDNEKFLELMRDAADNNLKTGFLINTAKQFKWKKYVKMLLNSLT